MLSSLTAVLVLTRVQAGEFVRDDSVASIVSLYADSSAYQAYIVKRLYQSLNVCLHYIILSFRVLICRIGKHPPASLVSRRGLGHW